LEIQDCYFGVEVRGGMGWNGFGFAIVGAGRGWYSKSEVG